jgi:CheY-like chemotaxis protein
LSKTSSLAKILLIEDEQQWADKISEVLHGFRSSEVQLLSSYDAAERFLDAEDLQRFDAIVVDVRMREQVYDQGGLALLDIAKSKRPGLPALVLTAYAYDYPGLRDVTTRYRDVLTYDKDVFVSNHESVLAALFSKLPPQIGDAKSVEPTPCPRNRPKSRVEAGRLHEVMIGVVVVAFVLITAVLVLLLFEGFSAYSFQLNVLFSVVVVALLCVLLRVFTPDIVEKAVALYGRLTSRQASPDAEVDSDTSRPSAQQDKSSVRGKPRR